MVLLGYGLHHHPPTALFSGFAEDPAMVSRCHGRLHSGALPALCGSPARTLTNQSI